MVKITYIFFSSIRFKALRLPFLWAFEPPCFLPCCSTSTGCPAATSPWQWTLLGLCSAARSWVLLRGCSLLLLAGWMLSGQGCRWSIKQSCQVGVLLSLAPFPPSFPSLSVSLLRLIFLGGSHYLDMSAALFLCIRRHTFGTAGSTGHWKTPCCFPARFSWSAHIWMHYCVHGIVLQGCLSREFPCSSCDLVSSETMSGFLLHCNQWPIPLLYFSILFDYAPNMVSFIHLVTWSNYCAACHAGHLLDLFEVILEDIGDLKTKSFHSSFC